MDPNNQNQTPSQQASSQNNSIQAMIPTQNMPALIGYYFGVFGLIPFVGFPLAIVAVILGSIGLSKAKKNPTPGAKGHAITALVLGGFEIVVMIAWILLVVIANS